VASLVRRLAAVQDADYHLLVNADGTLSLSQSLSLNLTVTFLGLRSAAVHTMRSTA